MNRKELVEQYKAALDAWANEQPLQIQNSDNTWSDRPAPDHLPIYGQTYRIRPEPVFRYFTLTRLYDSYVPTPSSNVKATYIGDVLTQLEIIK